MNRSCVTRRRNGAEAPAKQSGGLAREKAVGHAHEPARYLVLIESGAEAGRVARSFLADRRLLAAFDAAAPEVRSMTEGLLPTRDAPRLEWDSGLLGHTEEEPADAEVYTLGV